LLVPALEGDDRLPRKDSAAPVVRLVVRDIHVIQREGAAGHHVNAAAISPRMVAADDAVGEVDFRLVRGVGTGTTITLVSSRLAARGKIGAHHAKAFV